MNTELREWVERTDDQLRDWAKRLESFYRQDQLRTEVLLVQLNSQIKALHHQLSELEDEICELREKSVNVIPFSSDGESDGL